MTDAPDTAVIALGGNALAPSGEQSTIHDQFRHARESLGPIVDLAMDGWNVCVEHGNEPQQRPLSRLSADEAEDMDRAGAFGEGSRAPKIRAAIDFARRTGGRAIITELSRGREAVRGEAGTTITAEKA